jgi:hypothetical protein
MTNLRRNIVGSQGIGPFARSLHGVAVVVDAERKAPLTQLETCIQNLESAWRGRRRSEIITATSFYNLSRCSSLALIRFHDHPGARLESRMSIWRSPRGRCAITKALERCTKSASFQSRSISTQTMRPPSSTQIAQHFSTRTHSYTCKRDAIRIHIQDLAQRRRRFSTQPALSHGHIDTPKPGEELYVTFVDKEGDEHKFAVSAGDNLLDIAQANDLEMEGEDTIPCALG